jgi:hypothetical protein
MLPNSNILLSVDIFDFINNILFFKKKVELNCDDYKKYNAYIVNRWVSMNSVDDAKIVNETVNRINFLDNDEMMKYKFLLNVLPKSKYKKIEYIKKPTIESKS